MRRKVIKTPLEGKELEDVLNQYNDIVDEWNRRELDWTGQRPDSEDDWCPLLVGYFWELDPCRHVALRTKSKPILWYEIQLKGLDTLKEGTDLRNKIAVENVRRAYSIVVIENQKPSKKKAA
ncbi:hypothetical protein [Thiohalocapsa halophila]|uniref:hypothetical protein n=1 Tax=Thiohalocapsa halophila TaxID=69359 RepID=UPI001908C0C2|nr:hypothetical protein [Thiohalocapsa halophila]